MVILINLAVDVLYGVVDPRIRYEISDPLDPPPGCRFYPRCVAHEEACTREAPPLRRVSDRHFVACIGKVDACAY